MTKLSIITICYNEPNLEETCNSIVNQNWQDFEWIVIDGGSNEKTQKIWDKYKYRIDKFISEPDSGIYNAYNKGLKLVDGEWVSLMNAGDSFYSVKVLDYVFRNKKYDADVLYGDAIATFGNFKKENRSMIQPQEITIPFLICDNINTQAAFVKADLYKKYGLYNEEYKIVSDYEKWLIFKKNNVIFKHIPCFVANYDFTGISSNKKTRQLAIDERNDVINKYFTKEEIINAHKIYVKYYKIHYSFFEQLFSIKNDFNKTHKIITFLGIHIKIQRRNK